MTDDNADLEEIQEYFKQRWLRTEKFYTPTFSDDQWKIPIVTLLQDLRERGYYKQLHAGQSLYDLILSRSKVHNLRGGKPNIRFIFSQDGKMKVTYNNIDEKIVFEEDKVEITPQLEEVLNKLLQQPIL